MQGETELGAIIGDALVRVEDLLELGCVRLVASISFAQAIQGQARELLQAAGVLLLERPAALEETGEVLRVAGQPECANCAEGARTRALAMLALSRFNSVVTPISECKTSCTRCCVCVS